MKIITYPIMHYGPLEGMAAYALSNMTTEMQHIAQVELDAAEAEGYVIENVAVGGNEYSVWTVYTLRKPSRIVKIHGDSGVWAEYDMETNEVTHHGEWAREDGDASNPD